MKAENKAISRIRNTKNASFLTHGADDYDHKGLNRARRDYGKAIIRSWMEESDDESTPSRRTAVSFRVVINTQIYENYGTHCCQCETEESCTCRSYWKAKGGNEYHRNIGTACDTIALGAKGIQAIVNGMAHKVERNDRFTREYMIGWNIVPSSEETHDEQMYREMHEEGWHGHQTPEQHARHMASLILS